MKVGILIPNNKWFCPFVDIYTKIFDDHKISYDVISWCRDGKSESGCIEYKANTVYRGVFNIFNYIKFASFLKKTIRQNKYDRLVVFSPQVGIFISRFLKKEFKNKYIFDYRDLSIEQSAFFKIPFRTALDNSAANVISSPGFKKYLPSGYNYILSHNFIIENVRKALQNCQPSETSLPSIIDVLTIGGIRDLESNSEVIHSLANANDVLIRFVGRGFAAEPLQQLCKDNNYHNVSFTGYYQKEDEPTYVKSATFLNIFYPRLKSHDTALSNRFYNSLIYRKPMIVTADTTQGDYASKFGVGVAVENCNNLREQLISYLKSDNYKNFSKNANYLLAEFVKDYELFEETVLKIMK